jgi:hypothetical protein
MSTQIRTKDSGAIHATDRGDVTIYIVTPNPLGGLQPIGIAKTFTFGVNKPKTAIEVISQRIPAGYARNPEDRTFSMNQVNTFERIEQLSYFLNSQTPFIIRLVYCNQTDEQGRPVNSTDSNGNVQTPKIKIAQLDGVEFENVTSTIDANGTEFTFDFTGRFRSGSLTGDIDAPVDPVTFEIGNISVMPL